MRESMTERALEELLIEKLSHSKALHEDLQHYHRLEVGHPERSYAYLRRCLDRHIDRTQQERNRASNRQLITKVKSLQPLAALAAVPPPKAKGKAKAGSGDAAGGQSSDAKAKDAGG